MLKQVMRAMKSGEKAIFAKKQIEEAFDNDLQNIQALGFFIKPEPATIYSKDFSENTPAYIVRKGGKNHTFFTWMKNPRRNMELMGVDGGLYFTEGELEVIALGKGVSTSCIRAGFKVNRTVKIIVRADGNGWSNVCRGYLVERDYG